MNSPATPATRSLWPNKLLGPPPGLKELNVLCWGSFFLLLLIPASIFAVLQHRAGKQFHDLLPIDFIYFYGDGQIVNQYPPERLYDSALQQEVFSRIYPLQDGAWSTSPYPPLVGRFFSLYARLPIAAAYALWLLTSLALYITGCLLGFRAGFGQQPLIISLLLFFALIFPPFVYFTLLVGQLSSVAVFALGGTLFLERRKLPLAAGLILSILDYKPTLLLLVLPMLLLTRRFRLLLGYVGGTTFLTALATALSGVRIWSAFAAMNLSFMHGAGVHGTALYKLWIMVDLNSFLSALPGGRSAPAMLITACAALALLLWGILLLYQSAGMSAPKQNLVWAVVLTWTLILNVYVPIYDCSILVLSVGLTLGALSRLAWKSARSLVMLLGLLILVVSTVTESYARQHGIQLITVAIAILGLVQTWLLRQALVGRNEQIAAPEPLAVS